jgi:hypothetical protein
MLETIQTNDNNYIDDFVTFHFYGLFYDMLINDTLKNEWGWNNNGIESYISITSEYTEA